MSSQSGSPLGPRGPPGPSGGRGKLPGKGPTGSKRAPGGTALGGRKPSPPHGPGPGTGGLGPRKPPNMGCDGPTIIPSPCGPRGAGMPEPPGKGGCPLATKGSRSASPTRSGLEVGAPLGVAELFGSGINRSFRSALGGFISCGLSCAFWFKSLKIETICSMSSPCTMSFTLEARMGRNFAGIYLSSDTSHEVQESRCLSP